MQAAKEENLPLGYNYYFHDLEQLTGGLTIIGISPQNDNHLFDCINRSNLEKVVFYHFPSKSEDSPILRISNPYEIKDVDIFKLRSTGFLLENAKKQKGSIEVCGFV